MLQAIGLTSTPRRGRRPAVEDLTFEARAGGVTALLGAPGSGKTTALRLMLGLERGRGVTYFRGRPLHRIAHPLREVGALLGDLPGHPARTARGQLRMLCAAAGVPVARADDLLDAVGLSGLHDQRLGTLSRGMDRRLALAAALLADPHTLVLDEPAADLSSSEARWLYGLLHTHAADGGTVLYTTDDAKQAARVADRVVTVDAGRLVADQDADDFARTRLRPRVAVRTPHAARLAAVVSREARATRRSVEVVAEQGNRLCVYGSDCAEVGEVAFRHGILLHRLAEETGDTGPQPPSPASPQAPDATADSLLAPLRAPLPEPLPAPLPEPGTGTASVARPEGDAGPRKPSRRRPSHRATRRHPTRATPLPAAPKPRRGPLRPLRYELRRLLGVPSTAFVLAGALVASVTIAVVLARVGRTPLPATLAAWPELLPLPPVALGAGLIGALSFGDEFRYPVLSTALGAAPRRLGLLLAKLAVTAGVALLLALTVAVADLEVLRVVYGGALIPVPANWPQLCASWAGLSVGCAWAGLLAAGVFRATAAGVAAVLSVPVLIAPLVQKTLVVPSARSVAGLSGRLRELAWPHWPAEVDRWLDGALRVAAQPVGAALVLSLTALFCTYLFAGVRRRVRW
ncbi:ATP-binding cassette domain-containing protein [Streptomyces coeruleoprunus]|uniref:ATP-binding cassette domain-containing protein n=1 Tax=Streptomyces coeruleoprunus TaxID=285563 RepID=A0ABV9XJY3_9ACTN